MTLRPDGRKRHGLAEIRQVTEADWAALKATRLAALKEAPHAFRSRYAQEALQPDQAWRALAAARGAKDDSAGFLAYDGDRPVGLLACLWQDRQHGLVRLQSLWVAPPVRRSGVASALVDAAIGWAREAGARDCEADVTDANHAAEVFYWLRGFHRVAAHPPRSGVSRWLRNVRQTPAAPWPGEDEAVQLVDSDPGWPAKFEGERRRLSPVLSAWLDGEMEHVGSTAVPGLLAKPVVDIMAPVHDLEAACEAIPVLEALGYFYAPHRPRMHWFCSPSPSRREFHLILLEKADPEWARRLAFRDCLVADARRAREYAELKREAARQHPRDREAYTRAKSSFVESATEEALRRGVAGRSPPGKASR